MASATMDWLSSTAYITFCKGSILPSSHGYISFLDPLPLSVVSMANTEYSLRSKKARIINWLDNAKYILAVYKFSQVIRGLNWWIPYTTHKETYIHEWYSRFMNLSIYIWVETRRGLNEWYSRFMKLSIRALSGTRRYGDWYSWMA
jgi:ABC-type long-subunit fatty acid transport system fused permease/ATPase subunit